MASFGRCVNLGGGCDKAESGEDIPLALGAIDPICPDCGKPLIKVSAKSRTLGLPLVVVVVLLIAGALIAGSLLRARTQKPHAASIDAARATPMQAVTALVKPALRICGSNVIGTILSPELVRGFLLSLAGQSVGSTSESSNPQVISGSVSGKRISISVARDGSSSAFTELQADECDLGASSRRIKSGEAAVLHAKGDMLSPRSEHVIGLDGIAVIVSESNPLSSLTVSQLKGIFSGHITNWNEIGGSDGKIAVFSAEKSSGTADSFRALAMENLDFGGNVRYVKDAAQLTTQVSSDASAIGFVPLPYVKQTKALAIASGAAAVVPNALTVGRESYPLSRRLFYYTASDSHNSLVQQFVGFVQSDAGQQIVDHTGFVGSTASIPSTKDSQRTVPANAPAAYRSLAGKYDQAGFDFYFNSGSAVLDNKAELDVHRLVESLSKQASRGKAVILAGFADSTGNYDENKALSEHRADAAKAVLVAQGLKVKDTVGFGQELPIRDNATEAGREKNRRVEIFVTR